MYKSNGTRPQGGGWKGGNDRKFGGGGSFNRRDDRGFDRPQMHQATCATCGNGCEVPFKPNGSRPIYCRECFKKDGDTSSAPMRFDRDSAPRRDDRGFDREEKQLFKATCASCGNGCEVPFKPNGSKPVYCRACFGNEKAGATDYKEFKRAAPAEDRSKEQFAAINAKLDMIIKAMNLSAPAKTSAAEPVKAEKAAAPKAEKAVVAEKPAKASKAPAKKAAAKKKK
ncbi:MAG: CxxC-x17-CxxC domain-containing protein [Patescibacteria group bacterium]